MVKSEFCVFCLIYQVLEDARLYTMKLEGQTIKYNPSLDERMKFDFTQNWLKEKPLDPWTC